MMLKNSPPGVTTSLLMARPRLLMSSGAKITLKGLHDPPYTFLRSKSSGCIRTLISTMY